MKRFFVLCLVLLLLVPAASAAEEEFPFETSDWAYEDVVKALDLNIFNRLYGGDLRKPITRSDFAEKAASLAAIEYGSDLESYLLIMNYRGQAAQEEYYSLSPLEVAKNFGIIQGRGNGDFDSGSYITRQEAAVMLARTYHTYRDNPPDTLRPLSFPDQGDIAEWALEDVRLMYHLGIMTGTDDGRFDPLGSYTIEQCLVTLLRLHEMAPYDGSKPEDPFYIPKYDGGFIKNWDFGHWVFAIETDDYYICAWASEPAVGHQWYYIEVMDQTLRRRTFHTMTVISSNYYRGEVYARPYNAFVSDDGTKLLYDTTVNHDVYYTDEEGKSESTPVQLKGTYTVTMDLKTGEQTYIRADLT